MRRKRIKNREKEFEQKIIDLARVARVVAGGRRFRFRVAVVVGNRKGKVGIGVAKGADVSIAVEKAVSKAKKNLFTVALEKGTITHEIEARFKAAHILLKPASEGTGIIAGGPVRAVVELAGVRNIVSKMLGSNNKISNARATFKALQDLETREEVLERRGKKIISKPSLPKTAKVRHKIKG